MKKIFFVFAIAFTSLFSSPAWGQQRLADAIMQKQSRNFDIQPSQLGGIENALTPAITNQVVNILQQNGYQAQKGWFTPISGGCATIAFPMCCLDIISVYDPRTGAKYAGIIYPTPNQAGKITLEICDYSGNGI